MLARLALATLALGLAALAVPGPLAPAETASASCIYVQDLDACVNPCLTVQDAARRLGLPITVACPA